MQSKGCFAILLFTFTLLGIKTVVSQGKVIEASFYGESYVHIPFEDSKQDLTIKLEFQTVRPDGLLFLAAGRTDYLLVQLKAGIIEARTNLGSGEGVVSSARGVRLDNAKWHNLEITCEQGLIFLIVDGRAQDQSATPGNFHDLNIELGVYLGGRGNMKTSYLTESMRPFRGCLRGVKYNKRDILNGAQNAFHVSWFCDEEFMAGSDSAISFTNETSFVSLPSFRIYLGSSGIFSCDVKTRSSDVLLLFNPGPDTASKDFVAVELVNGKPKLSMDKGSGLIEVSLQTSLNDGTWHTLIVTISDDSAKIQVDSEQNMTRFHLDAQNYLNLGKNMYIGGLGKDAFSQVSKLGLLAAARASHPWASLVGCVRNINMNSARYGFQEIQVSRFIDVGCQWKFPCSQSPCIEMASCVELGMEEFRCECNQAFCVKSEFKQSAPNTNGHIRRILSVRELVVSPGGQVVINKDSLQVQDRYRNYFRQKNIIFLVKDPPQMGRIEAQGGAVVENSFTWGELMRNSIYYRHLGDNSRADRIVLEISVASPPFRNAATNKYDFVLPIRVTSRKQFQVKVPSGHVLDISPNGRLRITSSILNVESDTDPEMITFHVTYLRQAASYLVMSTSAAKHTTRFTLKDIQRGHVWFQHNEDAMVYMKLKVTDGVKNVHDVVQLRFKRSNFQVRMVANTGISIGYGSTYVITSQNLSFVAGSKLEEVDVRYEIIRPPQRGVIQLYSDTSDWIDVQNFTQEDIDSHKIRYHHFPDDSFSNYDAFKFNVISRKVTKQAQMFNIRFKTVVLTVERNSDLVIHKGSYSRLTNDTLLVLYNAENLDLSKIVFSIVRAPGKGKLYMTKRPITNPYDFDLEAPLKEDDTFSQMDVNRGFVYYKYSNPSITKGTDYLDLQASYFGYNVMVRTLIIYSPGNLGVRLINNGLKGVVEGGMRVISKQNLYIETDKFKNFTFTVTEGPSYGSLNLIDPKTSMVLHSQISSFITAQVVSGKIAYQHDDSEHDKDLFEFTATPNVRESASKVPDELEQLAGKFTISMIMRNDNAPVRVSNKIFHVVTGQVKTLSIIDLAFHDPDIDFDDSLLFYQRHEISNGDILDKTTEEKIFNFTQKDLTDERLIFHHKGESLSKVPILVSDGQFFSNSILEIQASEPFVHVVGSLVLEVDSGQRVVLDQNTIGIESNLDFKPEDVTLQLDGIPKRGALKVNGNTNADFSYNDIVNRQVKYHHWGQSALNDAVDLIITLKTFTKKARLTIEVTNLDTSGPPEIVHNQIFSVNVRQIQVISRQYLEARHKGYLPQDINYIITGLPQHGHLVIKGRPVKEGSAPEFSQEDINRGHVVYASDSPIHLNDKFTFDVGTESESLRDMEFLIKVIPEMAVTTHKSIKILEGGRFTFNTSMFTQFNYISNREALSFSVEQTPMHGKVALQANGQDRHVRSFSSEDLQQNKISYIHDDSESLTDVVAIKAVPQKSVSHPGEILMVQITVKPVDDQPPRVIVNSGLDLWSGSMALVTGRHLQAVDPDTNSAGIQYTVTGRPSNGHLAFLSNPFRPVSAFSQLDLDSQQVVFVHKGDVYGSFTVRVSDGKNQGESVNVRIRARPVTIKMTSIGTVYAFPGGVQAITNQSLLAEVSASNFSDPIIFTLRSPRPRKGRLVVCSGQQIMEIKSFTQHDVNNGIVFYQHTGFMRNWQASDQLGFDISTTYAPTLRNKVLRVDIAFSNINEDNYRDLLKINTPSLAEGGKVTISRENFDSSEFVKTIQNFNRNAVVHFSFESFARYGWLWFKDEEFEIGEEFTQADLNSQRLVYKHDNTDSTCDAFLFGIKILIPRAHDEEDLSVGGLRFIFNLTIEPVNDSGYDIITRHPSISVLQGSEVVVTRQNLTTVDIDTGPEGIEYVIVTQPDNGMLVLDSAPTTRLDKFTQLDINKLRLVFKHDGSFKSRSSVYFKVSDKKFTPTFANLDIEVRLLVITVEGDQNIPIVQGTRSVTLTPDHVGVTTNGDLSKLKYSIVKKPKYGRFVKHRIPVSAFSQQDLEEGKIQYIQNPDSQGTDIFEMNMSLSYINVSRFEISYLIEQKPLVRQGPLVAVGGAYVAITRASLDVSELARLTNDDPQFLIEKGPRYGKIMMRRRQRREAGAESSFTPVSQFTFEDIIFTRIYYVPGREANKATEDKFIYILSAKGVPSAWGNLTVKLDVDDSSEGITPQRNVTGSPDVNNREVDEDTIEKDNARPSEDAGINKETNSGEQGPSLDSNIAEESTGDNNTTIIIIVVVMVLCVVIVAAVVVVLIMRKRRAQQRSAKNFKPAAKPRPQISGPLQLEQPHVLIQPKMVSGIGEQEDSSSAPMISSPVDSHMGEHIALVSSFTAPGEGKSAPGKDSLYVNTAHARDHNQQVSPQQSCASPDITQVTSGARARPDSESSMSEGFGEQRSAVTSGRGSSATSDLIDWTLMDPDLLQSCNLSTPALQSNQYWL